MFRVSRDGNEPIVNLDTLERIVPEIRALPPGLWHIDEVPAKAFPSGHTSRRWGVGIRWADGSIAIERDLWEA
jgi:hypothetical protein